MTEEQMELPPDTSKLGVCDYTIGDVVDEKGADDEDHVPSGSLLDIGEEKDMADEHAAAESSHGVTAGQQAASIELSNRLALDDCLAAPSPKRTRDDQNDCIDEGDNKKLKMDSNDEGGDGSNDQTVLTDHPPIADTSEPPHVEASTVGITIFNDNDVLSGRGGGTNVHPGNRRFRDLIQLHRREYLKARKNDKPSISRAIVRDIRQRNGRFLRKEDASGFWFEIGDDAAREKTSQALRQRAPEMRKMMLDAERDDARVAVEEQMRHQRMMMGMPPEGVMGMPGMPPGMAFPPGAPPMMFAPTFYMPGVVPSPGGKVPTMPPGMMMPPGMPDPYQQAMFQAAFMGGMPRFQMPMPTTPQQMPMPATPLQQAPPPAPPQQETPTVECTEEAEVPDEPAQDDGNAEDDGNNTES